VHRDDLVFEEEEEVGLADDRELQLVLSLLELRQLEDLPRDRAHGYLDRVLVGA